MRKVTQEILNKVKNLVSEKKQGSAKTFSENETREKDNEINDWIQKNAEKNCKRNYSKRNKKDF